MALNLESLSEQLANVTNQLGHIRKQLQKELEAANKPVDQAAALREENAQLRAQLEARDAGVAMHYDTTAATQQARAEAEATSQDQETDTVHQTVKAPESEVRTAIKQQAALVQPKK